MSEAAGDGFVDYLIECDSKHPNPPFTMGQIAWLTNANNEHAVRTLELIKRFAGEGPGVSTQTMMEQIELRAALTTGYDPWTTCTCTVDLGTRDPYHHEDYCLYARRYHVMDGKIVRKP